MKEIPLTGKYGIGKSILVSDEDYDSLSKFKWNAKIKGRDTKRLYAVRYTWSNGKTKTHYMHREIMGNPIGLEVDHVNHNGLDNQRENLRICTHQENLYNKSKVMQGSSQFLGVSFDTRVQKWVARILVNNAYKWLGSYLSEIDAAKAYNKAALERDKDYHCLNVV